MYGRPKIDGELKICSSEKRSKQDRCVLLMSFHACEPVLYLYCVLMCVFAVFRYAFLFDRAMFICKKKSGETFELKEIIELHNYQIRDEPSGEKDKKKVFSSAPSFCINTCLIIPDSTLIRHL